MHVLLSIKPEFVDKIFDGTKKYEYRRSLFKEHKIDSIIVYASSPVKMVIGEFQIDSILEEDIYHLWEKTKHQSGIDKDYFLEYFTGKEKGYAIKIKKTIKYKNKIDLHSHFGVHPPQSFIYINEKPQYLKI